MAPEIGETYETDGERFKIADKKQCPHDEKQTDYEIEAVEAENMEEGETMWLCEDDL